MKEDILEQAVDDWLLSKPATFTKHNIKFRPDKEDSDFSLRDDSSHSDIDIMGIHLNKTGSQRVSVVTCKSFQNGISIKNYYEKLTQNSDSKIGGRVVWKQFRELVKKKWGSALAKKVYEETSSKDFTYYLAITKISGAESTRFIEKFENEVRFINNLKYSNKSEIKIKIITFKEIFDEYFKSSKAKTLEATELGRLIQIIKASGVELKK